MKLRSLAALLFAGAALLLVFTFSLERRSKGLLNIEREKHAAELASMNTELATLRVRLAELEKERDRLKADAAEVHKLRGELSAQRSVAQELQKQLAHASTAATQKQTTETAAASTFPTSFETYSELAHFVGSIRASQQKGIPLTPEQTAWLQQMKPELEKLEASPQDFATFQASMIQAVAGINDPQKLEQIRQTIEKVYQVALDRGLNVQSRPSADDADWVQQRHQIDRRGTTAVQRILSEEERAAFDRSFLGVMGVDLGIGVDHSLYPPNFFGDRNPR